MSTDILAVAETALQQIRAHNLHADSFEVDREQQGNSLKYDHTTGARTRLCLPEIRITLFKNATAFLAWCDYLNATRVRVHRGDYAVHFHLDDDQAGLCWRVSTSVQRDPARPHLPGIKPEWKRTGSGRPGKDAWISVEELRTTLTAMESAAVAS